MPAADAGPVWVIDDAPIMGGAEAFAIRLCTWLGAKPREALIICPDRSELAARARAAGVAVLAADFPLPAPRYAAPAAVALWRLRRLLARAPRDTLLVANTARAQAYAILATRGLRGPRLVSLMHEQDSARRPSARWSLRRFGGVAAVGDGGVATYRAALPGRTVARVANFLTPAEIQDAVAARVPAPAATPPLLGVLSRMFAGKGIVELVEELAAAPQAWSRVLIAAPFQDVAYSDAVRARVAAHGLGERIGLLGHVADVGAFLARTDVLVVPSTATEGQPTVVIEALAHGRPVLVREHLWQSEYEGLPVRRYATAQQLAEALAQPAQPPASAEQLLARFDPTVVLDTLERAAVA